MSRITHIWSHLQHWTPKPLNNSTLSITVVARGVNVAIDSNNDDDKVSKQEQKDDRIKESGVKQNNLGQKDHRNHEQTGIRTKGHQRRTQPQGQTHSRNLLTTRRRKEMSWRI